MSCQMIFLSIKSKMSFQINQITNGGIVHDSKDHAFRGRKRDSLFMRTLNGAGWLDKVEFLPSNNNRLGDINTDGSVDISDVILDLRIAFVIKRLIIRVVGMVTQLRTFDKRQ